MGIDFLHKTGKQHTKAWSDEFLRGSEDLFAPSFASIRRSFLASLLEEGALKEGDPVIVRHCNDRVLVLRDIYPLAEIEKPSLDLLETLNACCGVLSGFVEEVIDCAGAVSVRIGREE